MLMCYWIAPHNWASQSSWDSHGLTRLSHRRRIRGHWRRSWHGLAVPRSDLASPPTQLNWSVHSCLATPRQNNFWSTASGEVSRPILTPSCHQLIRLIAYWCCRANNYFYRTWDSVGLSCGLNLPLMSLQTYSLSLLTCLEKAVYSRGRRSRLAPYWSRQSAAMSTAVCQTGKSLVCEAACL